MVKWRALDRVGSQWSVDLVPIREGAWIQTWVYVWIVIIITVGETLGWWRVNQLHKWWKNGSLRLERFMEHWKIVKGFYIKSTVLTNHGVNIWGMYIVQSTGMKELGGCILSKANAWAMSESLAGTYAKRRTVMVRSKEESPILANRDLSASSSTFARK